MPAENVLRKSAGRQRVLMSGLDYEHFWCSRVSSVGLMAAALDVVIPDAPQAVQPVDRRVPADAGQAGGHVFDVFNVPCLSVCRGANLADRQGSPKDAAGRHSAMRRTGDLDGRQKRFRRWAATATSTEYPTGRIWRDAKLYEIGAGTSEIRRMLIGRELYNGSK